jgi:3-hydroxybutyryl-CoA dehydrogenase
MIGIVGAGAMGSGIAQVAAQAGEQVLLFDSLPQALVRSREALNKVMDRLVEKGRIGSEEKEAICGRFQYTEDLSSFTQCELVIEAIIEDLQAKRVLFEQLEKYISETCILATNTSSLSIASLSMGRRHPEQLLGIHFFNPAPLLPLVEIIPSLLTDSTVVDRAQKRIDGWGKVTVRAQDTPGFIVNRVARPFYGEALKMVEEGVASALEIDAAMRHYGFRMGPFELMDLIGNDVNYAVTETVWTQFFYDPRFKPSLTQKRMSEAGLFGRKSGRGYYEYNGSTATQRMESIEEGKAQAIFERIFCMLVNEAYDALFMGIASREDIDLAMTKGVNYPRGLFEWSDSYGREKLLGILHGLFERFGDDRYRANTLFQSGSI